MAGERTPGPVCQVERPEWVQDGTMCVAASAAPNPVGLLATNPQGGYEVESSEALQAFSRRPVLGGLPPPPPPSVSSPHGNAQTFGSAVSVGAGIGSVLRIPIPGSKGLFLELSARGWRPKIGSTSTLFIQDVSGSRHLRLDYGYNRSTDQVDYHWNQSGTFEQFGIANHTPAGPAEAVLYRGARYFRYGGRVLLIAGLAQDVCSIVIAKKRWRQVARVAGGWAGSAIGCELVGSSGAAAGTLIEPGGGTAVGGFLGCFVGGIGGYAGMSWAAGHAYDWVEETLFEPLPEAQAER